MHTHTQQQQQQQQQSQGQEPTLVAHFLLPPSQLARKREEKRHLSLSLSLSLAGWLPSAAPTVFLPVLGGYFKNTAQSYFVQILARMSKLPGYLPWYSRIREPSVPVLWILGGQRTVISGSLNIPWSENRHFRLLEYSAVREPSFPVPWMLRGQRTVISRSVNAPRSENRHFQFRECSAVREPSVPSLECSGVRDPSVPDLWVSQNQRTAALPVRFQTPSRTKGFHERPDKERPGSGSLTWLLYFLRTAVVYQTQFLECFENRWVSGYIQPVDTIGCGNWRNHLIHSTKPSTGIKVVDDHGSQTVKYPVLIYICSGTLGSFSTSLSNNFTNFLFFLRKGFFILKNQHF